MGWRRALFIARFVVPRCFVRRPAWNSASGRSVIVSMLPGSYQDDRLVSPSIQLARLWASVSSAQLHAWRNRVAPLTDGRVHAIAADIDIPRTLEGTYEHSSRRVSFLPYDLVLWVLIFVAIWAHPWPIRSSCLGSLLRTSPPRNPHAG